MNDYQYRIVNLDNGKQVLIQDVPGVNISVDIPGTKVSTEVPIASTTVEFEALAQKAITHDIQADIDSGIISAMPKQNDQTGTN